MKQETFIRNLSRLKDEKIIDMKGKEFVIPNPAALEETAQVTINIP